MVGSVSLTPHIFSAGVGRTGTFIGMDIILEQAMKEGVVNVVGVIKKMREQRVYMVQAVVRIRGYMYRHCCFD